MSDPVLAEILKHSRDAATGVAVCQEGIRQLGLRLEDHQQQDASNFEALRSDSVANGDQIRQIQLALARAEGVKEVAATHAATNAAQHGKAAGMKAAAWVAGVGVAVLEAFRQFWPAVKGLVE